MFHFIELEKIFFLEARSNSKIITLIKTKALLATYHGDNNSGDNDYCEQMEVTYNGLTMSEIIITETFFLSGFTFTNIHDSQNNWGRGRLSL